MNGIVPATQELIERFYGVRQRPEMTTKSLVAVKGGEPVGVAGSYLDRDQGRAVLFGDFTDELRADKRLMLNLSRAALAVALAQGLKVYSLADPAVEGSKLLLAHIGGKELGGGIFEFEGRA